MNKLTRNLLIVVLKEDHSITRERVILPLRKVLQDELCALILWVRFTREDELNGTTIVVHQAHETMWVCQDQLPTFVRSDAARKAYRQCFRVEHGPRGLCVFHALVVAEPLLKCPVTHESNQSLFKQAMSEPKLLIRDGGDSPPPFFRVARDL